MTVYAVMVFERHIDPDVELFTVQADAVARAREIASDYARGPDDIEESESPTGWLYYARWGAESDHVFVIEREIQGAT